MIFVDVLHFKDPDPDAYKVPRILWIRIRNTDPIQESATTDDAKFKDLSYIVGICDYR